MCQVGVCHWGNEQGSRSGRMCATGASQSKAARGRSVLGTLQVEEGLAWTSTNPMAVGILWVWAERGSAEPKMHLRGRSKPDRMLSHLLYIRTDFCRFALDKERSLGPRLAYAFIWISSLWRGRNIISPVSISYALKLWAPLNRHEDHQGNLYIMQFLQCKPVSV